MLSPQLYNKKNRRTIMNKNKIIDVLRLVAGNNNIIVTVTHKRNGLTSNVIVNKVFDDNTIEIVEYGYIKTINLDNIGRIEIKAYCTNN